MYVSDYGLIQAVQLALLCQNTKVSGSTGTIFQKLLIGLAQNSYRKH